MIDALQIGPLHHDAPRLLHAARDQRDARSRPALARARQHPGVGVAHQDDLARRCCFHCAGIREQQVPPAQHAAFGAEGETQRRAGKLKADLQYARIDEILSTGLHAFLTQFLDRVNELGGRISQDFLVPVH